MAAKKKGLAHRLYTGEVSYDFIGHRKWWYLVSAGLILLSLIGLGVRGLNLGIEFKGGADFQTPITVTDNTVPAMREAIEKLGLPRTDDTQVMTVGSNKVRVQTRTLEVEEVGKVRTAIAQAAQTDTDKVTYSLIGASWGKQITQKGIMALGVFLVLVMLLIWIYFRESRMAVAAIVALLHDLLITVGIYALVGFSVTPATLIGILTILGYSLYDTVVVFDKIKENTHGLLSSKQTYGQAANKAINQVLVRSLNTTVIGVLPVAALLAAGVFILGTGPLKDLGLALFIGMLVGAYSSIFLATPVLVDLKNRQPEMKEHEARLVRRSTRTTSNDTAVTAKIMTDTTETTATAIPVAAQQVGLVDSARARTIAANTAAGRPQPVNKPRSQRKK
ncbi:MAG: protein translocase subunit SecF [Propionibacteriaceae bacterium]